MMKILGLLLAVWVVAGVNALPVYAAGGESTPMPGGAYQLKGLNGSMSSTMFNGNIRIKKMSFRKATPKELIPAAGETDIVFTCIVSNGTNERRTGYLGASLVDADGIVLNSYGDPEESLYTLDPGAAARQSLRFTLKNGFTPAKLILSERGNGPQPVFRISVRPSDLPR